MRKETAVAAIIVVGVLTFVGGYMLGAYEGETVEGEAPSAAAARVGYDSNIAPVGESPVRGPADAKVTLVFFADFTASSTAAAADIVDQVASDERFADDVRLVVKALPGRGEEAQRAVAAAYYASEHGRFWDGVYEDLLENANALDSATIDGIVERAGLDPADFRQAVEQERYGAIIEADVNLARSLGIGRAPAVLVNGRSLTGNDLNRGPLREAVFGEQEAVRELGEGAGSVYSLRVRENASPRALVARREGRRGEGAAEDRPARREPPEAAAEARHEVPREARREAQPPSGEVERLRVPIEDTPIRGGDDALVTIVEFSDFHCPFCSRVGPTLEQLFDEYGDDIRLSWRHNPLPMHPDAPAAHRAAMAAHAQGRFWEMHDQLFANQRRRAASDHEEFATEIGIDLDQFRAYISDESNGQDIIERDQALARQVGARGTPHFFINGRRVRGAQPIESFREVIDSELALARQMLADGTPRSEIYDRLMEDAQEEAAAAPERAEAPSVVEPPPVGDSPSRGPGDAPVTIMVFSEFQCPYCGRAQPTLSQIEEEYGDRIRWVFKSFPLPFHSDANLAAQASLAANEQGRFWEYHDVLFQNQRSLSRADLESYAEELGLNMDQFREALDSGRFAEQVDREMAEGRRAGVSGTPTFLINGERVVGAVPFERFRPVIERHLSD